MSGVRLRRRPLTENGVGEGRKMEGFRAAHTCTALIWDFIRAMS